MNFKSENMIRFHHKQTKKNMKTEHI